MATLNEAERQELLRLSQSAQLRHDMRMLRKNRERFTHYTENYLDCYLEFLNEMNEMMNYTPKPFRKIEGEYFLL